MYTPPTARANQNKKTLRLVVDGYNIIILLQLFYLSLYDDTYYDYRKKYSTSSLLHLFFIRNFEWGVWVQVS